MLLVLPKKSFCRERAAQQCVTLPKRFSTMMATIWYKIFRQNICPVGNRNV